MKNLYWPSLLATVLLMPSLSYAQPEFESIKLTAAPAYVVLGVEPENISRPGSPTEFIAGIQNAVVNGKLTPNFALEFTPYYWKNPKKDSLRFEPKDFFSTSSVGDAIRKTFTISLATSASDSAVFGKLVPGTAVGIGVRFTLWEGRPSKEAYKNLQQAYDIGARAFVLGDLSVILNVGGSEEEVKKAIRDIDTRYESEREVIKTVLSKITSSDLTPAIRYVSAEMETTRARETALLDSINRKKFPFAKQGFMLEAAAAESVLFQDNEWGRSAHARLAAWLTPSFRWDLSSNNDETISLLDAMGVIRYTFNNTEDSVDVSNYFDVGGKCKYSRNRWSFDFEFVYRYATDVDQEVTEKNYTYRATSSLEYRFSDRISFKATYGTTFNGNTATYTDPKDIFVLGGVNVGLFKSDE